MTNAAIVALVLILFAVLLAAGTSVALSLGISGIAGIVALRGFGVATDTLATVPYSGAAKHSMIVVPLFILLGALAYRSGLANNVYTVVKAFSGKSRSAVPITGILSSAGFAAVTGSSVATVAALGPSLITEMEEQGFKRRFGAGLIATAGTLGILIPPSIVIVLYGIITGEPIGALLIAGIIPGIVSAILYCLGVIGIVRWGRPFSTATGKAPATDKSVQGNSLLNSGEQVATGSGEIYTRSDALPGRPLAGLFMALVIFTTIMGGIFLGLFTVTESAAMGAVAALLMFAIRGQGRWGEAWRHLQEAVKETLSTTGMIFFIIIGGSLFTYFLVSSGVPTALSNGLLALDLPPLVIVGLILLAMIPLGMVLEGVSILLIVVPLVYPVITELGYDGIWFGILVVKMIELGLITPPVGLNAFVISRSVPGLPVGEVFRGLLPWYLIELVVITALFFLPGITTFLPALMAPGG